jgi:hypothetical protein
MTDCHFQRRYVKEWNWFCHVCLRWRRIVGEEAVCFPRALELRGGVQSIQYEELEEVSIHHRILKFRDQSRLCVLEWLIWSKNLVRRRIWSGRNEILRGYSYLCPSCN